MPGMTTDKIRVGIIGASADRGWAKWCHLPALTASPHYRLTAIAASTAANAEAAASQWGVGRAYHDPLELIADPEVDLVTIAVPLTKRHGLVEAAIAAGKHVYCEWPLASDASLAADWRDRADAAGLRHAVGLQTRHHPAIRYFRDLIVQGWAGDPLSASLAYTLSTPPTWPARHAPLIGTKAVSRIYILGGHALDLFRRLVGDFTELSATTAVRLPVAVLAETGEQLPTGTPDQIAITGTLKSGAVASVHIVTGSPRGSGYRFEFHGTKGRLALVSTDDSLVGPRFVLYGGQGQDELRELGLPDGYRQILPGAPVTVSNVYQNYEDFAEALRTGGPFEPSFDTATQVHRIIDAVEASGADRHHKLLI